MTKYWITKYALSGDGIIQRDGERRESGYISIKLTERHWHQSFKLGSDVFETEGEAKIDADKKRLKKIASLKKQIAKLEAMKF